MNMKPQTKPSTPFNMPIIIVYISKCQLLVNNANIVVLIARLNSVFWALTTMLSDSRKYRLMT